MSTVARHERYALSAVVEHQGGSGGGHYVTYRRFQRYRPAARVTHEQKVQQHINTIKQQPSGHHPTANGNASSSSSSPSASGSPAGSDDDTWLMISDETVRPVPWHAVQNAQAYLLFYTAI
jgi:ubiquitin C-terminal hydrolase